MKLYTQIYNNICERGKQRKSEYKRFSGLHKHHIIPKHSGGKNLDENYTYLTSREHTIAHFLLWKINQNPNDLRSLKMLGVTLTPKQRRITGKWCHKNMIGMFGMSQKEKRIARQKGIQTQIQKGIGIFNESKRKEYAKLGGKASYESNNNSEFKFWLSKKGRKIRSSLGGKSLKGRKAMHIPGQNTFERVKPEDIETKLKQGYIFGTNLPKEKTNKGKQFGPNYKKRKKVTDGHKIYESIHIAAKENNITPSGVIHRCKSPRSSWSYVFDNES